MDLKTLEQQDATDYSLKTPAGDKTDIVFQLAGPTHPVRQALEKRLTGRGLRQLNKHGKVHFDEDPDELRDQQVDRLVLCTLGWKNMEMEQKPYPFSQQNARELYSNPKFGWVRDQIDEALRAVENFIKPQSASLSPTASTTSN